MDIKGKKILVVATTDDMIGRFMIPHIQDMQKMGAEVECACNKHSEFFDEIKSQTNCKMHEINFTRFPFTVKNLKGYVALKKIVKENKFDLIHCMQPVGGVMGRLVAKKFKIKCLYVAHGFHFYKGCPIQNKLIYKTIERVCSKYTTSLVVMNEEDFVAAKHMKAKHVYKINGIGVDLTKYKIDESFNKNEFRETLGFKKSDFIVASVGELNKNKNTLMLIDAIAMVKAPNVKYVICGEGDLRPEYEKRITELGLQDNVKMLGFRRDIPNILNCVDCYVMPSYREGLSKSMMESMAYALPVVASKIRGNIDLIGEDGGILCEPSDVKAFAQAINRLAKNKRYCVRYGERNKKEVQKYDINVVLEQMRKIYEEI